MKSAFYESPYGVIEIGYEGDAVARIRRVEKAGAPDEPAPVSDRAFSQLAAYFAGQRRAFDFPVAAHGTAFQEKVWCALREIPYGQTRTYGQIASAVGNPKAARAVGMANNKNPVWIVIPCHRVVGADGALTGYAGGLAMKEALLALERGVAAGVSP